MNTKIEIKSSDVVEVSGTSKMNKAYKFFKQEAWFFNGVDPYPAKFELIVDVPSKAYPVGTYQLSPASVYVDRNGRLSVSPKLVPVASGAAEYKAQAKAG